jgi:hypothetical protein
MSDHHTFALAIRLRIDLGADEVSTLRYIINGEGLPPTRLPSHAFFQQGLPRDLFWRSYRGFAPGSYQSVYWTKRAEDGTAFMSGVHLHLPSQKLEGAYGEAFALAQWLATLSVSAGHVGSITCEDDGLGIPTLLLVREGQLCIAEMPGDLAITPV